jgi:hemerythrin-like metal-binding protein/PAS domain S-box-containing protein
VLLVALLALAAVLKKRRKAKAAAKGSTPPPGASERAWMRGPGRSGAAFPDEEVSEGETFAICHLDAGGRITHWSREAEGLLGWRAEEVLGRPHDLLYPEEEAMAGVPEADLQHARMETSVAGMGWRRRMEGTCFPAAWLLTVLSGEPGMGQAFLVVIQDRSGRLEAEERLQALARTLELQVVERTAALQESEARLQGVFRHASAAIAVKGLDGRLLLVNRRAEVLIGLSLAATPDASRDKLFPADQIARARAREAQVLQGREEQQTEECMTFPDGSVREYLIQQFPLTDGHGRCWGLGMIATNVTERKLAEKAHVQGRKIEALGLLAGGIAHNFNNILGAMLGRAELAREEGGAGVHLHALEELIARAASLVDPLLAYAGRGRAERRSLGLNREVEEMARVLRASLASDVNLRVELAPGLPSMEADGGQVRQVIANLVLNSVEALGTRGGAITIRTGQEQLGQRMVDASFQGQALEAGRCLVLEVCDDGPGMAREVRERIFDPFFTTKHAGRGLGLTAVQGILRSHGGGILVTSAEGRGSSFKAYFPAAVEPAPEAPEPLTAQQGSGAILVVEDEDALRAVAVKALQASGFQCLEARDGIEALEVFKASWDRIRLILLDLTMPSMGGEETYRSLRRAGAMAPIVLCSGFGPEEALRHFRDMALAGFLRKPYSLQSLRRTVQETLDGAGGERELRGNPPRELLVWAGEYECGHAFLDHQHKSLLYAFNHLVASTEEERREPEKALNLLVEVLVSHWGTEEGLMVRSAFPGLEEHRVAHATLGGNLKDLARRIHRGETSFCAEVLDGIENDLLNHIQLEDRDLARHLVARGC